ANHPAMLRLKVTQSLGDGINGPGRHSRALELFQPVLRWLLDNAIRYGGHDRLTVFNAGSVRCKALVAFPFRMITDICQPGELPVISDCDDDRLIRGVEWLVRNDVRVGVA